MKTIYVIGYQPIDLISKQYKLVDLLGTVIENGVNSNNIFLDLISYLRKFEADDDDFLLINSVSTRNLIPYCKFRNTLLYDPPYVFDISDVSKLLRQISEIIGDKNSNNIYMHSSNSIKALLAAYKENIPQSYYYNILNLLTDLNKSDTLSLNDYIMKFTNKINTKYDKYAIFFGDVIDSTFFDFLNSKGIYVLKFLPYEFFCLPSETIDDYYYSNPFFQSPINILIELKRIIHGSDFMINNLQVKPSILILNPGGIYLTKNDADFYVSELSESITTYVLPGLYKGVTLQL